MVLHKMSPIKYLIHISSGSTQILSKDVILEEVCRVARKDVGAAEHREKQQESRVLQNLESYQLDR